MMYPHDIRRLVTPQAWTVYRHLQVEKSITGVEASSVHNIRHLPRRIADLRECGVRIRSEFKHDINKQRYVRYHLEDCS